jgi:hypothetical protein
MESEDQVIHSRLMDAKDADEYLKLDEKAVSQTEERRKAQAAFLRLWLERDGGPSRRHAEPEYD